MNDQELNMKLVGEVEKREVLYNYKLPGYSRKDLTEKAWKEVSVELGLPARDCKEKWRNLRTVFIRKMKPSPCGSGGRKKAYYLEDAMRFCLPFIKVVSPSSGNLPTPCITQQSTGDNEGSETQVEEYDDESTNAPQNFLSMSPSNLYDAPQQTENPPASLSSKSTSQIQKKKNKRSAALADQLVAAYFTAKKAKLLSNANADIINQKIDRQQGIKMFLLSLLPELDELSDSQIKLFKRQVLRVIDDISALDQHQQPLVMS
ncbi:uncharacterized protein LOC129001852 [Macrosteles quadrilineatus]|uniref:uncharacterized protein LOC129001852 n=1 Tax=Macrosteles quadrilineatus TaxID=74068 RepID=UPI0023E0D5E2|nr:uncharacterized protein LOC129001852 [Macrosteles quadrilineatus]